MQLGTDEEGYTASAKPLTIGEYYGASYTHTTDVVWARNCWIVS